MPFQLLYSTSDLLRRGLTVIAGLSLSLTVLVAAADAPASASTSLIPASLVAEALDLDQAARALQNNAQTGREPTTLIYVDSQVPRLLLLEMTLQIDVQKPVVHRYGQAESLALQTDAAHRLASLEVTPGPHRLYAEYVARYPEDKPGTPRLRTTLVQEWEQPEGALAMQLSLTEAGLFGGRPQLALRQWTPVPNGLDDAELHSVDLLIASGHVLEAAEELLALRQRNGGALPENFLQRLNTSMAALQGGMSTSSESGAATFAQYDTAATAGDIATLDRLGREKALDERTLALRDKANTALGFHMLEGGRGEAADEALRRVRSPGPYSEMALLGLGWSQLVSANAAPATATAVKTALGSPASRFDSSWTIAGDKQADDLRRALVPWTELIGRDPTEAPVQEAMLAIPYAMDHLGAHQQAQVYTQRAIEKLQNTRQHLSDALTHITNGGMIRVAVEREAPNGNGWAWWLSALPEPRWWLSAPPGAPENFYMERLLQDEAFRAQLQVSRRLFEIDRLLAQDTVALADRADAQALLARIEALRGQLTSLKTNLHRELQNTATREVTMLRTQTEKYLVEAHFAMARLNDRPETALLPPKSPKNSTQKSTQ